MQRSAFYPLTVYSSRFIWACQRLGKTRNSWPSSSTLCTCKCARCQWQCTLLSDSPRPKSISLRTINSRFVRLTILKAPSQKNCRTMERSSRCPWMRWMILRWAVWPLTYMRLGLKALNTTLILILDSSPTMIRITPQLTRSRLPHRRRPSCTWSPSSSLSSSSLWRCPRLRSKSLSRSLNFASSTTSVSTQLPHQMTIKSWSSYARSHRRSLPRISRQWKPSKSNTALDRSNSKQRKWRWPTWDSWHEFSKKSSSWSRYHVIDWISIDSQLTKKNTICRSI